MVVNNFEFDATPYSDWMCCHQNIAFQSGCTAYILIDGLSLYIGRAETSCRPLPLSAAILGNGRYAEARNVVSLPEILDIF